MDAWVYIWTCLTFGVKTKLRNIRGYDQGFNFMFTVFIARTLFHISPLFKVWTPAY